MTNDTSRCQHCGHSYGTHKRDWAQKYVWVCDDCGQSRELKDTPQAALERAFDAVQYAFDDVACWRGNPTVYERGGGNVGLDIDLLGELLTTLRQAIEARGKS